MAFTHRHPLSVAAYISSEAAVGCAQIGLLAHDAWHLRCPSQHKLEVLKFMLMPADGCADHAAFTAFERQMNRELASSCDTIPVSSLAHHCIWLPDGLRIVLITANLQGTPLEHGSHLRLIRLRDGSVEMERFLHGNLRRIGGSKYMHPILVWALSDRRLGLLDAASLCFR